ncbi:MAG: tetratricopeptide repeat protein [Terriglobales bacterium]
MMVITASLLSTSAWAQRYPMFDPEGPVRDPISAMQGGPIQLRGRVTFGSRPASGALIRLQDPRNGMLIRSAQTGDDGMFTLPSVEPGLYLLTTYLGLQQVQEQIQVNAMQSDIEVRFASDVQPGGSPLVSAAELRIPDKARDALQDARHAMSKHDNAKAQRKIADALKIAPKFAAALTLRAVLALAGGNQAQAIQDLDRAIRDDPYYPEAYFMMGAAYNDMKQYRDAQRSLEQGMRLNPVAWQGHFEMSRSLLGLGDAAAALREAEAAIKTAPPNFAEVHLARGAALLQLQRYGESATELEAYLKKRPDGSAAPQARQVLAQVREKLATLAAKR